MNDGRDFELTSSDKKHRNSSRGCDVYTRLFNRGFHLIIMPVTLLHEKDLFSVASVPTNLLAMYVI